MVLPKWEGGEADGPGVGSGLQLAAGKKVSRKSHFAVQEGATPQPLQQCRASSLSPPR